MAKSFRWCKICNKKTATEKCFDKKSNINMRCLRCGETKTTFQRFKKKTR